MSYFKRRDFLKTTLIGGVAVACSHPVMAFTPFGDHRNGSTRVSISTGNDRADMAFRALAPFSEEIRRAIGNRRVVLKPNNVLIYVPQACTHVDTLEGILEFLKSIGKLGNVVIAESSASDSTLSGFENFGYLKLLSKYPVKLADLDNEPFEIMYVVNEKDYRPHPIRVSSLITDPQSFVVSVARMKTHHSVGATLSLKNIVFGAPIKDPGFTLYHEDIRFSASAKKTKPGTMSDKRTVHGGGVHAVNYNMAMLAPRLHPDLAVIDGYEGMEGNGPTLGTVIDHRVCIAGPDWLAADRVGIELMGIDFSKIGYLQHCARMNLGIADLSKIEIVGESLKDHVKQYRLPDNFDSLTGWMDPKA